MRKISGIADGILASQRILPLAVGWLIGWSVGSWLISFFYIALNVFQTMFLPFIFVEITNKSELDSG
jgi:ATP/ADP translocase